MDLVVRIPTIPKAGETLLGGIFQTFPGGKGGNQAVAAARLGAQVNMIGCVGEDSFGEELCAALACEGIDVTNVIVHPEESTGVALIQVDGQGQNSISVASGANLSLSSADVERALQSIGEFDALVMPLEIPLEVVVTAAHIAVDVGALVILNPAPAQVLGSELLRWVDFLVPNEHEITDITGITIRSEVDLQQAAEQLHHLGLQNLLVTLGSRGSWYSRRDPNENLLFPAKPVQAIDTTAAGDCFVGALTVGLCEGKQLRSAVKFASSAAAISVTRFGAQPSLPNRTEVEQFIQERMGPL